MKRLAAFALCACAVGGAGRVAAQTAEITGTTRAVDPQTRGILGGQDLAVLHIGAAVYRDEHVVTDRSGRTLLLFLDGLTMTIGPNEHVILNRFRYDPSTRRGQLAATAGPGDIRVTGAGPILPNPELIETASQQAGGTGGVNGGEGSRPVVRVERSAAGDTSGSGEANGGVQPPQGKSTAYMKVIDSLGNSVATMTVDHGGPGSPPTVYAYSSGAGDVTFASVGGGSVQVSNAAGQTVTISRSGYYTEIRPGAPPTAPRPIPPGMIEAMQRRLEGSAGTGQRASAQTLQALSERNSGLPIAQLQPTRLGQVGDDIYPVLLDRLAGLEPRQLGTLRQDVYIQQTVDAAFSNILLPFLPATVTVSTGTGSRTATYSVGPSGRLVASPPDLTPSALIGQGGSGTLSISSPLGSISNIPVRAFPSLPATITLSSATGGSTSYTIGPAGTPTSLPDLSSLARNGPLTLSITSARGTFRQQLGK